MDLYSILDGYIEDLPNHKTGKIGGWALARKWALTQLAKLGDGHLHGNGHSPNWQNWGMGTYTEMGTHPIGTIGGWALARKWALTQLAKLGDGHLHGNGHLPNWQNWVVGTCTEMGTHPTGKIGWWGLAWKCALTEDNTLCEEANSQMSVHVAVYLIPWSLRRGNEAWYSLTWLWLPVR